MVIIWVTQYRHARVVLRSCPDEGDSSYVDFFHRLRNGDIDLGDSLLERIEIAHHIIDLLDPLLRQIFIIRLNVPR